MKSLERQTEPRPFAHAQGVAPAGGADGPRPLAPARWDWSGVRSVLVVRLRSIGDTVLATPSIHALRRFLPEARIDVLLEDWVAPLLDGSDEVDRVIRIVREHSVGKVAAWREMRRERYDVAYNLHGGSTASLFTLGSRARERVGYASYRAARLQNHDAPHPSELWGQEKTHSAEQQLGLLGWTGVPVTDRPASRLPVTAEAAGRADRRLRKVGLGDPARRFALIHPAAAFDTKTWAAANFARVAEDLGARGIPSVAVVGPGEARVAAEFVREARIPVATFDDLSLPELSALAARASLFVGNDSGVAHIAAAHGVPSVVVFGSSNVAHWRPWTTAPAEVVREEMPCAPCPGYHCHEFGVPECIRRVPAERVVAAVGRVLKASLESGV
jgi:ADP-heptose:LPS heptosyltransferase